MTEGHRAIIVGAGILGLASAYHLLQNQPGLDLLVVERLAGPGRGDTAKSAAAFRDMFSSPVNRHLSQAAIAFYDHLQQESHPLGLKKIGYLWLATAEQMARWGKALEDMAQAGVKFHTLETRDLTARLPELRPLDLSRGILGLNCGILDPARLIKFYEQEVLRLGGNLRYRTEVTGFSRDSRARINGIRVGPEEIRGAAVIIAAGAWTGLTLALAGLEVPLVPRKRQLFSIPAREGFLGRLLAAPGFNAHNLLPFTILPGEAYLRPAAASFILGYANPDQAPGLEEPPRAENDFYENRIRPQLERYFPVFQGLAPTHAWAGHYDEHLADSTPFVESLAGALVVGGSSGSGVMKADSLGRIVAGRWAGLDYVELGDGGQFRVAGLGLQQRAVPREEFVI
ncbi:MAG: NAD(P)/FAD-dependent oxidoreductase [Desulfobaccales bacterium]